MKFGVREICDVVLKKKAPGWFGKLYLEAGMPVIYFDTLKTSTLEGAATTVYAQGGKGNPRLVAWEGDRTVTFTMEDALISPESFSVLSGAGLMDASTEQPIFVHATQQVAVDAEGAITLENKPAVAADSKYVETYVMIMTSDGAIDTSFPPVQMDLVATGDTNTVTNLYTDFKKALDAYDAKYKDTVHGYTEHIIPASLLNDAQDGFAKDTILYVDYYVKANKGVKQIDIEAGKFGGSYYLEASTLFRDQATGEDYAAEFIIPNCKVQSNFTFTMAPSGDPSTFTFTMDAFPDYTKFDKTKKVIAALQIVEDHEVVKNG
ncbi:MAG: hypothetical protein E7270_02070 [Lachnospiraceae bacterium]|nr:hypothetical protein [Lachnospiraceae bacterium]